ncbi:glycoprotein [Streptomyces sp. NPDC051018]|uniref:glycoprotein n=1 Tax=Streptomyces sp. NPDC051018 TaxID=3365639 RepID=UPI003789AD3D
MSEPSAIDKVLRGAAVLKSAYDDYDTGAALHRLGRDPRPAASGPGPLLPGQGLSRCEQAGRDLDLAATLIVNTPQAAPCLGRLLDHHRGAPSGALVFAALLHLAGHLEGAQFWWQSAADGGNGDAAFCLSLLHENRAEFRTARYWRKRSALLKATGRSEHRIRHRGRPRRAAHTGGVPVRFLPASVRHELIGRCHRGDRPALPPAVQALVHGLPVEDDVRDFGEVPRPDHTLTALQDHPVAREWSWTAAARRAWSRTVIRVRTRASGCTRPRRRVPGRTGTADG